MDKNGKYATFKREEWSRYRSSLNATETLRLPSEVPDAEVIRHQDITSPGIFWSYTSAIQQLIETVNLTNADFDTTTLEEIRQHFRDAALSAELVAHKIPD